MPNVVPNDPLCPKPVVNGQTQDYPGGPNKNRYSPDVYAGLLPNMPDTDITVVPRKTVLFAYPFDAQTTVLEVRNPELNDLALFQAYRIQTYTRGDGLIVYRDPQWFKTRVYNWSFTGLTRQNRQDILDFLSMSAGKYITVTDFLSRQFKAIIINVDNPITQELPDYSPVQITTPNSDAYKYTSLPGSGYTWKVDLQKALV